MNIKGGCFCGSVRYVAKGSPSRITMCHCKHCRRTSGAPLVAWAEFQQTDFIIVEGSPAQIESRPGIIRQFCQLCGTQLTYQQLERDPAIYVTVCSLDEPEGVVPQDHTWASRMLPWLKIDDGLPRHELSGWSHSNPS